MMLLYYKGAVPNFGDNLNPWLWPQLLPRFFDDDAREVFVGIGSILSSDLVHRYGPSTRKIVFGTGYVPAYFPKPNDLKASAPDFHGYDWTIYFVRGPRTAAALRLPAHLALGDAAILVRTLSLPRPPSLSFPVAFMPHWESLERGHWPRVCELAGIKLIDPRRSVCEVMNDLLASKLVITEAMHGAIVADALRIPWIPILPLNKIHREKWFDWAESLQLPLKHHRSTPSSLREARLSFLYRPVTQSPLLPLVDKGLVHLAAASLDRISRTAPSLSDDHAMDRAIEHMLGCIEKLKKDRM
jgi:hypothetical protein